MSDKPENPPAFPILNNAIGYNCEINQFSDGMSLRDYFAAAALQGFCANPNLKPDLPLIFTAYKYADAMLHARQS